jgi:hypothetical protein
MPQVNLDLPSGSKLSMKTEGGDTVIIVPYEGGPFRYFTGLFVLAWLGGWFFGFSSAASQLASGRAPAGALAFLAFWLVGWTLGGGMAVYWAYRAFRPSTPESLRLTPQGVTYDSGVPPLRTFFGYASRRGM